MMMKANDEAVPGGVAVAFWKGGPQVGPDWVGWSSVRGCPVVVCSCALGAHDLAVFRLLQACKFFILFLF